VQNAFHNSPLKAQSNTAGLPDGSEFCGNGIGGFQKPAQQQQSQFRMRTGLEKGFRLFGVPASTQVAIWRRLPPLYCSSGEELGETYPKA
jgi:hypothetical protein